MALLGLFIVSFIYSCIIFWLESRPYFRKKIFIINLLIFLFLFFIPYFYSLNSISYILFDNPYSILSGKNYIDKYALFMGLPLFFIYFIFTIYKKSSISFNDITLLSFFCIFLSVILIFMLRDFFGNEGAGWLKLIASAFLMTVFVLLSGINFIFQTIKNIRKSNHK